MSITHIMFNGDSLKVRSPGDGLEPTHTEVRHELMDTMFEETTMPFFLELVASCAEGLDPASLDVRLIVTESTSENDDCHYYPGIRVSGWREITPQELAVWREDRERQQEQRKQHAEYTQHRTRNQIRQLKKTHPALFAEVAAEEPSDPMPQVTVNYAQTSPTIGISWDEAYTG